MMKSKIHRAVATQSDLHYVGSVAVDEDPLDADNRMMATGLDPAETFGDPALTRGDSPAR